MFTRRHAQASPSVTLEKGVARLRFARTKPPLLSIREDSQHGTPFYSEEERRASAVLACIAFATLLTVCLALYLLSHSSRWELSLLQFLSDSELASSSPAGSELFDPFLTPLPEPRRSDRSMVKLDLESWNRSEQYLSYLPHSGFHNQRIALENALVLAYILNRTLLVPYIRLGEPPIRYRPSQSLRVDVALSSQIGLEHCIQVADTTPVPEECKDFWRYTQLPWDWLVNLSPVAQQHDILMMPRQDLSDTFLRRLGISTADTFFLHDTAPYQFRFFDQMEDSTPVGLRYNTRINLHELIERARPFRLLQFGTLFGTSRLRLADPAHATMRRDVRRAMVFTNPELLTRANAVSFPKALGDHWSYLAVHLRLGDGVFADLDRSFQNTRHVWWRLIRELGVSEEDATEMEALADWDDSSSSHHVRQPPPTQFSDLASLRVPHPPPPPASPSLTPACQEALHQLLRLPLYIATDNPTHPALKLFTRTFPCVYFLGNFSQLLDVFSSSQVVSPMSETVGLSPTASESALLLASRSSSSPPARLLAPFLDALIASKARVVVGTPGSTFSRFVEDVLWRQYHDWEIVERG